MFPWLAGVASKYDQYRIKNIIIDWIPTGGITVSGSFIVAYEPNPMQSAPKNFTELAKSSNF